MNQYQSDDIGELAAALALARAAMPTAKFNRENPHFKSRYADLASIADASVPHLSANGLSIVQQPGYDETGSYVLFTKLLHKSNQWMLSVIPLLNDPANPQKMMASLTYSRRGGWSSMIGMATEEDDDGNLASGKSATVTPSQLDELMATSEGGDMAAFLPWVSKQLGYEVENLNMVQRVDVGRVKTWLKQAKARKA